MTINPNGFSQTGTIKGRIHDNVENQALPFANVFLVDKNIGASSDINGYFIIDNIPIGTYDFQIRYVGYPDSVIQNLIVTKDTIINLNINYPPPCQYNKNETNCPICHKHDKVIPILYGLPSKKLMRQANKGKAFLGGCVISYCEPNWYCKRDKKRF